MYIKQSCYSIEVNQRIHLAIRAIPQALINAEFSKKAYIVISIAILIMCSGKRSMRLMPMVLMKQFPSNIPFRTALYSKDFLEYHFIKLKDLPWARPSWPVSSLHVKEMLLVGRGRGWEGGRWGGLGVGGEARVWMRMSLTLPSLYDFILDVIVPSVPTQGWSKSSVVLQLEIIQTVL